jgi:hypothetical protein
MLSSYLMAAKNTPLDLQDSEIPLGLIWESKRIPELPLMTPEIPCANHMEQGGRSPSAVT